jgi:hypothetical protein
LDSRQLGFAPLGLIFARRTGQQWPVFRAVINPQKTQIKMNTNKALVWNLNRPLDLRVNVSGIPYLVRAKRTGRICKLADAIRAEVSGKFGGELLPGIIHPSDCESQVEGTGRGAYRRGTDGKVGEKSCESVGYSVSPELGLVGVE